MPQYLDFIRQTLRDAPDSSMHGKDLLLHVLVAFGAKILTLVPGRVSTEVDARFAKFIDDDDDDAHSLVSPMTLMLP